MEYIGDYAEDYSTLNLKFSSRSLAQVPTALVDGVVSVYKANGTTQSTAGVTLTADFDGVTGLNNVLIDLSADAFYAVANDYAIVLTSGTVSSISVAGTVLAHFSIENRFNEVDVTKIGGVAQSATDLKDFADSGYDPSTHKVQGVVLTDTTTTLTGYSAPPSASSIADAVWDEVITSGHGGVGSSGLTLVDALGYASATRTALTDLRAAALDRIVGTLEAGSHKPQSGDSYPIVSDAVYGNSAIETLVDELETRLTATRAGYLDNLITAPPTASAISDAVWDEVLTGATHNVNNSAGKRLRDITSNVVMTGTSPGSNTASKIILDSGASSTDGAYDPAIILITAGTGTGQSRQVWEYDGATRTAYINRDWKTVPDNTSEYAIFAWSGDTHINEGVCRGGGADTITLNTLASDVNDSYVNQVIFITSGTGQDQCRKVIAYNGTTKVATVDSAWETQPVSGSIYTVLPYYTLGGGDATSANQTTIINHLTDVKGSGFNTANDSLKSIRDRGDIAWITGSGLSGSNTVTLTIQDGSANNIVGAFVEAWDSAGTSFLERKISNSSGQVVYSMDDGTYTIKIIKSGYSFTPEQIVVSGNTSHTYDMTPYVITPPASPSLCRVYGYFFAPDGTYHTTLTGLAEIGIYDSNNQYYTYSSAGVYDNTTGLMYWDIVRGASATVSISELLYFKASFTVPDQASEELDNL